MSYLNLIQSNINEDHSNVLEDEKVTQQARSLEIRYEEENGETIKKCFETDDPAKTSTMHRWLFQSALLLDDKNKERWNT